jgi:hypothetical protein
VASVLEIRPLVYFGRRSLAISRQAGRLCVTRVRQYGSNHVSRVA